MTFREQLSKMDACESAVKWVGRRGLKRAWAECQRADWMMRFAARRPLGNRQQIARAWCACARTSLKYVPEGEERPRLAIEAKERWTDDPTPENKRAAHAAADGAYVAAYAFDLASAAAYAAHAAAAAADGDYAAVGYAARAAAAGAEGAFAAAAADARAAYNDARAAYNPATPSTSHVAVAVAARADAAAHAARATVDEAYTAAHAEMSDLIRPMFEVAI